MNHVSTPAGSLSEARAIWQLALPIMAGLVGQTLIGIADTVMVGSEGVEALAAASLVVNLFHLPLVFGFGMLSSIAVLTSHAFGAGDTQRVAITWKAARMLTWMTAIPLALLLMAMRWLLPWMGQPPSVIEAAGPYLWWVAPSLIPLFLGLTQKQFCESLDRPWIPTFIMLGGVLLNILLNALLIRGRLGFPAMELNGAGLATLISRMVAALCLGSWIAHSPSMARFTQQRSAGGKIAPIIQKLRQLGTPVAWQHLLEMGVFALGAFMLGWIHAQALAAHQIAFTCASTTFMFSLSLGMATSIRVGQAIGAGERHRLRRIGSVAIGHTLLIMSGFAAIFLLKGPWLVGWFIEDPEVISLAITLLIVAACFQVFDGLQVVIISILRGMQDVTVPAVIAILAYWLVTAPLGYWLTFSLGLGALGIWIGFASGLCVAAIGLLLRFTSLLKLGPKLD